MEYLEGTTLRGRLEQGALPVPTAVRLGWQMALTLAAAHGKSLVHRDLKPENVFVVPDPTGFGRRAHRILDFGIAKLMTGRPRPGPARARRHADCPGTRPTCRRDGPRPDRRVRQDRCVCAEGDLHEMLTGALAAQRPPLGPPVPQWLAELVGRMQAADPAQRPAMAEVARELAGSHAEAPAAPQRSRRGLLIAGALAGVAAAGGLALVLATHQPWRRGATEAPADAGGPVDGGEP